MKRTSLRYWIFVWFTVILLLALTLSAGWNYYWTNRSVFEQADHRAGTCTETARQLLEEWEMEELGSRAGTEEYEEERAALRSLCQRYRQNYLYVYTIDPGTNVRRFVYCVASSDEDDWIVRTERYPGSVSTDPLDDAELAILAGAATPQKYVISNRYGYVSSSLLPYHYGDGSRLAIIGVDYSIEDERETIWHHFLIDIVPIVFALALGFLVQLAVLRRRVTNPILRISESMRDFAQHSSVKPEPLNIHTQDEIGEIASSYEKMTGEISTYIANIEALTREKVETNIQLDIARRIQYGLVPEKSDLSGNGFSIHALTHPAKAVGGDFYDCFLRDDKTVCIVMGDVSGKGVSAALFMAVAKTLIREKLRVSLSPAQVLNEVNDALCAQNPENLFATVFAGTMDVETGDLTYANAGHTHPVLLGSNPSYLVPDSGIALGLFEDAGLKDYVLPIRPGEGILLYTDGITEAVNPENDFFGEKRLLKALSEQAENDPARAADPQAILQKVSDSVDRFRRDREPFDDAALLVLIRNRIEAKDPETGLASLPVALSSFGEIKKTVFASIGETPAARQILLVCDEVLANIVSYSGAKNLAFACRREGNHLILLFSDDGFPFDPAAAKPKEMDFDVLDSGGMGLSLIRQNASSMRYERKNGRNELTLAFDVP